MVQGRADSVCQETIPDLLRSLKKVLKEIENNS